MTTNGAVLITEQSRYTLESMLTDIKFIAVNEDIKKAVAK